MSSIQDVIRRPPPPSESFTYLKRIERVGGHDLERVEFDLGYLYSDQ